MCPGWFCFAALLCIFIEDSDSSIWSQFEYYRCMQITQRYFKFQQGWLSPHCQGGGSLFTLAWSDGLLFFQSWHSLRRQLMSWVISWKCQRFLVELLSPQTRSHPSCTAHCTTRAGASLCLAAMSQQAQELPGSHRFPKDSWARQFSKLCFEEPRTPSLHCKQLFLSPSSFAVYVHPMSILLVGPAGWQNWKAGTRQENVGSQVPGEERV